MYPKTFFETNDIKIQSEKCFVIMPFSEEFDEVYETIREALETNTKFTCERADDVLGGGHIMESVLENIAESEIIIADLTGKNPNVFYELGITHMIKQPNKVILLTQDVDSIPFDLNSYRNIVYKQSIAGAKKLKIDLQNAIKEVADFIKITGTDEHPVYQFKVEDHKVYKFPVQLFGDGNCLYDFEIFGDYVGEDAVKFTLSLTRYIAGKPPKKLGINGYGLPLNEKLEVPNIPWNIRITNLSNGIATFQLTHN